MQAVLPARQAVTGGSVLFAPRGHSRNHLLQLPEPGVENVPKPIAEQVQRHYRQ